MRMAISMSNKVLLSLWSRTKDQVAAPSLAPTPPKKTKFLTRKIQISLATKNLKNTAIGRKFKFKLSNLNKLCQTLQSRTVLKSLKAQKLRLWNLRLTSTVSISMGSKLRFCQTVRGSRGILRTPHPLQVLQEAKKKKKTLLLLSIQTKILATRTWMSQMSR